MRAGRASRWIRFPVYIAFMGLSISGILLWLNGDPDNATAAFSLACLIILARIGDTLRL
jgi:hypothetical protein